VETIEYKRLSLEFEDSLGDLASDVEDVEDGEISDNDHKQVILNQAKDRLDKYDEYLNTLEDHFAEALKKSVGKRMEYIRGLLAKIAQQ